MIINAKKMADSVRSREGTSSGTSVQERLDNGLIAAVQKGQASFVKSALQMKGDVNALVDVDTRLSCLQAAISACHTEIAIVLAQGKADLQVSDSRDFDRIFISIG